MFHMVNAFFAVVFTSIYGPPALPSTVGQRFFPPQGEKPTPSSVARASTYVIPNENMVKDGFQYGFQFCCPCVASLAYGQQPVTGFLGAVTT